MEAAFRQGFSDVRIHEDGTAPALGALAYTQGSRLHFAPGRFQPESPEGQEILRHELTHVIQQRQGRVGRRGGLTIDPDPALEAEAVRNQRSVAVAPAPAAPISGGGQTIQRMPPKKKPKKEEPERRETRSIESYFQRPAAPSPAPPPPSGIPASTTATAVAADSDQPPQLVPVTGLPMGGGAAAPPEPLHTAETSREGRKRKAEDITGVAPAVSASDFLSSDPSVRLRAIRTKYPQLAHVPGEHIADLKAHNPGGPPIRLGTGPDLQPSGMTRVDPGDFPDAHIVDLSRNDYKIYQGEGKPPKEQKIDEETEHETRQQVRAYALLTNAYIKSRGGQVTPRDPSQIYHPTERFKSGPRKGEAKTLADVSTDIAGEEHKRASLVYQDKKVGHVPDTSVSGVSHSPMGFLPMTGDANALVGNASGIGLKYGKPISHILVRERNPETREVELHHYSLPPLAADRPPAANTTTSSESAAAPFSFAPPPVAIPTASGSARLTPPYSTTTSFSGPSTAAFPFLPPPVAAPGARSSMGRTPEEIERSRQEALRRRAEREKQAAVQPPPYSTTTSFSGPSTAAFQLTPPPVAAPGARGSLPPAAAFPFPLAPPSSFQRPSPMPSNPYSRSPYYSEEKRAISSEEEDPELAEAIRASLEETGGEKEKGRRS